MKKDSYMLELQKIAGSSMMAVETILTMLINDEDCDKLQIVSLLNDIAKMAIQMHHDISVSRRSNIFIPNLAPQAAEIIKKAEIHDTLIGNKFAERIKESKALTKLSENFQQKSKPTATVKRKFLFKSPQSRRPFSQQQTGYNQKGYNQKNYNNRTGYNRGNQSNKPNFRSRQQFFNSQNRNQKEENTSQKK
ncbi:uncharacterized protein LOC116418357 [Nasonia vitripennis]|uniref:Uncharacterized protein n=1 Tax=Nasonia vitripennis TaxID=7425 RepID=A0A7M7QL15_NASVI|nr:uncharacterized protein LOC116418357 [Nasonia vitripennis]